MGAKFDYSLDYKNPELYRVGKSEQGVCRRELQERAAMRIIRADSII